eukprot:SAG31_NODE_4537_length_3156_cov_1.780831_1_plen_169_part_00
MAARAHGGHYSSRQQTEKAIPLVIEDRSRKGENRRWSRGKALGKVSGGLTTTLRHCSVELACFCFSAAPTCLASCLPRRLAAAHMTLVHAQGGFATCYEIRDMATNQVCAGKVVRKSSINKSKSKQKVCAMPTPSSANHLPDPSSRLCSNCMRKSLSTDPCPRAAKVT